ncbi:hypothetical protein CHL76_08500 [Marinococcus halophilus]|uniref:DUF4405 domain-containing protein n=1 Tax=Marinococcus halophilus TaxID=1371 RepID=A0A510Y4C0_MARHA|nr:hypothetical protein CHL76_08500 [Marinococcus halophilus]GEK58185.1 hypothetical protein MHA01_10900 [Marinococcus halophilus]
MRTLQVIKGILIAWVLIHGTTTVILSLLFMVGVSGIHSPFSFMWAAVAGSFGHIAIDHKIKKRASEGG